MRDEISFGLAPGGELPVTTTICDAIRDSGGQVVIDHDEMSQHLTALTMGLQVFAGSETHRDALLRLTDLISRMDQSVHRLARDLRPAELDDLGLVAALSSYVEEWSRRTGIQADLTSRDGHSRWAAHVESALYRIVQEALTNVARHARTHRASVVIDRRPDGVAVVIEDDGVGFDADRAHALIARASGSSGCESGPCCSVGH